MAEFTFQQIVKLLPNLKGKSDLQLFLNRAEIIQSTLVSTKTKEFFLKCVKACCTDFKVQIETLTSWDLIKAKLVSIILPYKSILQILEQFLKITQYPKENIQSYHSRIVKITNELDKAYKLDFSNANTVNLEFLYSVNEKNAIRIFIKGIRCKNLKTLLKSRDFETLSDVYELARIEEVDEMEINENAGSENRYKCVLCFRYGHLSNYCRYTQNTNGNTKNNLIKKPLYQCTLCYRSGHLFNYCRYAKPCPENIRSANLNAITSNVSQVMPNYPLVNKILFANLNTLSSNCLNQKPWQHQSKSELPRITQESRNINFLPKIQQNISQYPVYFNKIPHRLVEPQNSGLNSQTLNFPNLNQTNQIEKFAISDLRNQQSLLNNQTKQRLGPSNIRQTCSQVNSKLPAVNLFDPNKFPILSQTNGANLCNSIQERQGNPRRSGT